MNQFIENQSRENKNITGKTPEDKNRKRDIMRVKL